MNTPSLEGFFVALEGVDGCGKSTQVELLEKRLKADGRQVLRVREPGGTPLGEAIREILLNRQDLDMCAESELLLFLASRTELYDRVIRPALDAGHVVISDRYHLSTVVYQGIGRGLGEARVASVCREILGDRRPHLNVVVELPIEECEKRLGGARDRIESDRGLLERVADGFRETAGIVGDSIVRVDGIGSTVEVSERVWEAVRDVVPQ